MAQTVIDIKHRRQFPETPLEIVKRLEEELDIKIINFAYGLKVTTPDKTKIVDKETGETKNGKNKYASPRKKFK